MSLNSPDLKELKAIVDWVGVTDDVREFSLKFGDVELFVSRNKQSSGPAFHQSSAPAPAPVAPPAAPVSSQPVAAAPAPAPTAQPAAATAVRTGAGSAVELAVDEVLIKAPMVGTFYASPKPGAPAFVKVGDTVQADTVLCIVEVMKLMNNIEAGVAGTVTKILVDNEQAVEYGQPIMVIRRSA
ncbi:acetyl-CoA carboxylase biotin carboxyl carrier protein [Agrobacterium tumefaciens]|nr:acetyl-CoA carboxylase biotin carboxyl carrier protein [Agrobacterium tumefaciens]TQN62441.1 acetyl-CoA carboxylase biotin carboxyl carrier protein [Agrobacterium tumefaciens]